MAIQSTSGAHHADRVAKARDNPEVRNWLDCGVCFYVYSWRKGGPRGKRKTWGLRVSQLVSNGDGEVGVL